jgi:uncharacterized protein (DUF2236 family)
LQVAHPQVARGVAAHSRFRTDTLGRLHRTLEAVYSVAFGTSEEIAAVRQRVARAHQPVKGPGYNAFDPDAQLWVLATLIHGSVSMYQRFVGPLTPQELDQLLVENAFFGEVFGLNPSLLPTKWPEFIQSWNAMLHGDLLGSDPLCAQVANAVILPQAPFFMKMLSPIFRAMTVEYLPEPLRVRLAIAPGTCRRPVWGLLDALLPHLLPKLPDRLRFEKRYLLARTRFRAANSTDASG